MLVDFIAAISRLRRITDRILSRHAVRGFRVTELMLNPTFSDLSRLAFGILAFFFVYLPGRMAGSLKFRTSRLEQLAAGSKPQLAMRMF
jgi:hypothetical protein